MTQRKALSTLAVPADVAQVADRLNRELIPRLRQVTPGTAITVSRAGMSAFETQLLPILVAAGIVTDKTVP